MITENWEHWHEYNRTLNAGFAKFSNIEARSDVSRLLEEYIANVNHEYNWTVFGNQSGDRIHHLRIMNHIIHHDQRLGIPMFKGVYLELNFESAIKFMNTWMALIPSAHEIIEIYKVIKALIKSNPSIGYPYNYLAELRQVAEHRILEIVLKTEIFTHEIEQFLKAKHSLFHIFSRENDSYDVYKKIQKRNVNAEQEYNKLKSKMESKISAKMTAVIGERFRGSPFKFEKAPIFDPSSLVFERDKHPVKFTRDERKELEQVHDFLSGQRPKV